MRESKLTTPKLLVRLFNTESRQKEIFKPLHDNYARIYTCGPTVYHYAHIGNFRTYIFEDLLRRTLKFFGYQVIQVMNITDVDDKTIRGTVEKKSSLHDFTQPYKDAFFEDIQTLGIERVERYPAATDYIPQMVGLVQKLIDKGFAYKSSDGSVYFSIDKFHRYGRLSHLNLDELVVGARAEAAAHDEYDKENVGDFVLWKVHDPKRDGNVFWESPFGPGRPGWHLECSAMAIALLGETLDIHVGAVDNIFPHHENEIAQSEAFTGKPFVKLWMHSDHLIVNRKKMSKSLGNFFTLRDLLQKGYEGMDVRYMLMHIHYRTQLNFTFGGLEGAKKSLLKLNDFIQRYQEIADSKVASSDICLGILQKSLDHFAEAMADDLNISAALSHIFDMTHEINVLFDGGKMGPGDGAAVVSAMQEFNRVLGVFTFEREDEAPKELQEMLAKRNAARSAKNWALADQMRDKIHKQGYLIEDTAGGTRLKKR